MESLWLSFGSYGSGPGELNCPYCITIDTAGTGLVYVSEGGNDRVSVFTSDGKFVNSFGQFRHPIGIALGKGGYLYICDYGNNEMKLF